MRGCTVWICLAVLAAGSAASAQEVQPRFDLRVEARQLSFDELSRLVPALERVKLPPGFRITRLDASGPLEQLRIEFAGDSSQTGLTASAVLDAKEPGRSVRGTAALRNVDLAALLQRPALPDSVTAEVTYDLQFGSDGSGLRGTFSVRSPSMNVAGHRAAAIQMQGRIADGRIEFDGALGAYGASVTADGSVTLGDTPAYDVRGRVRRLDLRRLPRSLDVPELASNLAFAYRVSGGGDRLRGRATLSRSTLEGAEIDSGTVATFERRNGAMTYHAEGRLRGLNLRRAGRALEIEALSAERFESDVTARFSVDGRSGRLDPVRLTIEESTLFGGRVPAMQVRVTSSDEELVFEAGGSFTGWNPGVLAARGNVQGDLSGTLDVRGRIPRTRAGLQTGRMSLDANLTLDPSSVEGVEIADAQVSGRLVDGELVTIERLELSGDELALRASGDLGLDPSRETALEYFVETPPLGAWKELIGADVDGTLTIEGRVTGGEPLEITGTLTGSDVSYGANRAAELSSEYAVTLPRDDLAAAEVKAETTARQLALGGREFETLSGAATYRDREASFDASLTGADQSADLAGRVELLDDGARAVLTRLGLHAADANWQLAPGTQPAIVYGGRRVAISDLRLEAGAGQSLTVNGAIGRGEALKAKLAGIDIAPLAALAGRDDVAGRLSADATLTGTLEAPVVAATFELSDARYRHLAFSAVTGQVDLDAGRLSFDTRVERPDGAWLEARGGVPAAFVRGGDATGALDVTIESSPIGLDLVQTLTDRVSEVTGTVQVNARLTGTADDPRPDGRILIADAAFRVPEYGTRYQKLDATIALEPDAIAIERFVLVDDEGDRLTASGKLPVSRLRLKGVEVSLTSDGLEVLDNDLGDIEIATDLRISGELTAPRVTGRVELKESTLNVDQILDLRGGNDAYAVRAAEQGLLTGEEGRAAGAANEGLLADLPVALDVDLEIPSLLLRGRNIRTGGSSRVGLGDINLTAQGRLDLQKASEQPLRVTGAIRMVRGTYEFQGREFELVRGGTVRFAGLTRLNPLLDVTARREISAVETRVHIGGTLEEPALDLSSSPPLDDADILSLIVFNQPANALGTGERVSLASQAGALASGFVAGQLTQAIGGAFDVDLLEIEAGATDGGITPAVTIGEEFGNLFVKVQQQFGADSQAKIAIEYALRDWLRIESSFVDGQASSRRLLRRQEDSGIDAVFTFEY